MDPVSTVPVQDNKRLVVTASVLGILALTVVSYYFFAAQSPPLGTPQNPEKTDFFGSVPPDFPANIPLEEGAKVEQSYSLDYGAQKQLTYVFDSKKTSKENYSLYADFFESDDWGVLNTHEGETVSALYASKDNFDINVTISKSVSGNTQVSISVANKI